MGDTGVGVARAAAAAAPADASAAVASKAAAAVEAPSRTAPAYAANRKATADMPAEARFSVSWYDQSGADSYTDLDSSTATPRATISTDEGPFSGSPCCLHLHRLAVLQHQVENKPETETLGSLPFLSSGIFNTGAPGGPPAPSDAVASLEAPAAAHEGKTEAGEAPTEASELEGGEAAAAAAAAEGSLWNQGVTPLRSLMETMFSQGALGAPRAQSTATFPIRRSRTSSMTGTREAFQGKLLGQASWMGLLLPSERLPPLYSFDSNAINYHLLPLSLLHKFKGAPLGPPADEIALPQTPPPERVRGPPLVPADKKKPGKKGGKKKKKKKARGAKRAPKGGSQPGPPPSSLLPTIENYWGPPFQRPHQEAFQGPHGAPLGSGASVEGPDKEEISSFVSCVQGVSCLDGGGAPWLTDRQLGALILRVGGPLRCLSLGKNHVGVETEKALAACPKYRLDPKP
ncbi:hypothetical protein, conserved [Eimeria praecox]|uniref:Uncharacterized protein n=1 Tax=Eimeria praecox TaxID=51316 RepID=U6G3R9_9EIME|nr:hypothetical protein, conserved [Eimeria praecox]